MGKFNGLALGSIIGGVILLVLAIAALTAVIPVLNTQLTNLTGISGLPFASIFAANGIIVLMLLGAVILGVVGYFGLSGSKR